MRANDWEPRRRGREPASLTPCHVITLSVALLTGCSSAPPLLAAEESASAPAVTRLQKPDADGHDHHVQQTIFEAVPDPFTKPTSGDATVRIRAHVNQTVILDEEVRGSCYVMLRRTMEMPEPQRTQAQKEILEKALQQLIERELILSDASARFQKQRPQYLDKLREAAAKEFKKQLKSDRQRIEKALGKTISDGEVVEYLKEQGLTMEAYRRQFERQFMAMEYLRARVYPVIQDKVDHQAIVDYYQQHAAEYETVDSVTWQDIFIDASRFPTPMEANRFAAQVVALAKSGQDFAKLADKYDNGDSHYRGGEGSGHRRDEIQPPELAPVLFQLHDGDIGPVVQVTNGYHIVRMVKREYAGRKPLDVKLQTEIRRRLQNELADRETKRVVAELRRKASIEIAGDSSE